MKRNVITTAALLAAGTGFVSASAADAASTLVIKGRGFGHGVGMSQYGAYGFAKAGTSYRDILAHYYTGTQLSTLADAPEVGVLLGTGRTSVVVTQATAAGAVKLDPGKAYRAVGDGTGGTVLKDAATGKKVAKAAGPMRLTAGGGPVKLRGPSAAGVTDGEFRGSIEVRPSPAGGLNVINAVALEDYVRGVVAAESPSSWPADALRAQAVAARTYALTTNAGGAGGFTQYADTRSQVYRGVAAETATTDAAVQATSRQVVTYQGALITTFFFSTSGGRTENVENSFLGADPKPYLVSVKDPYDRLSPKHTWTARLTLRQATSRLGSLVRGQLKRIEVVRKGVSPRVVSARIVGTRGTTTVSGPALKARLGLLDTWASFTVVTTSKTRARVAPAVPRSGGLRSVRTAPLASRPVVRLRGRISGRPRPVWLTVQRGLGGGRWRTVAEVQTTAGGRYVATVPRRGVYRVRLGSIVGPNVRVG
ncbi:MAG: SpoIID/LytB protein [Solirubrobacterales bacterium]|nr:SpoIID/LytB protein [Solirubrobacterales bacterium]